MPTPCGASLNRQSERFAIKLQSPQISLHGKKCEIFKAYISPHKLSRYLLSKIHPIGWWKSKLFRTLGFGETNADLVEQQLIDIAN
jgi:hypothetical protein